MTYIESKNPSEQRKFEILKVVNENRGIHHNALRKIIVDDKHVMAKRTFDKLTKELRIRGTLQIISGGDKKIHYVLPSPINGDNTDFEKDFEIYLKSMENKIKIMKKDYEKFSIEQKQGMVISSLSNVFSAIVGLILMNSIGNTSTKSLTSQEIKLRQMVKNCVDMVMHDKDATLVIGTVNDSILSSFNITQLLQIMKFDKSQQ